MVGMLDGALQQAMATRGITAATAAIAIRDAEVLQSLASGASADALAQLPAYLRSPLAVLWDASRAELLYVATEGKRLLLARVGVTGALPEVRGVSMLDDLRPLEQLPLLRGSLE